VPFQPVKTMEVCFSLEAGVGVNINGAGWKFGSVPRQAKGATPGLSIAMVGELADLVCDCVKVTFSGELMLLADVRVPLV